MLRALACTLALGFVACAEAAEVATGVALDFGYMGEFVRNFQPGHAAPVKRTIYQDHMDLALTLEPAAWGGPDLTLFVHGVRDHGHDPSAEVLGDLQTASNIEAPDQLLLYEAWLEARVADGRVGVLAGLHDLNSEFYVSEFASLFLNSSFGIGPEISLNVPASIFPQPGWGALLRVQNEYGNALRFGVYDGDPTTRAIRRKQEGLMGIAELELHWVDLGEPGVLKLGWWKHTGLHPSPFAPGRTFHAVMGAYGILEQRFVHWPGGGFGAFVQYGQAQRDRTEVPSYLGVGVHVAGFIPGRPEDEIGLALARAEHQLTPRKSVYEATWELTLRLVFFGGRASLQPSWQHILHPGGDPAAAALDVGLLRMELAL